MENKLEKKEYQIELYCKNPKCFVHYLAKHKIKEIAVKTGVKN